MLILLELILNFSSTGSMNQMPPTAQGLWVAPQPLVGLWVAPTFLHATTRPKQLFIDAIVIDTTNTHYTR